jgi:parallel beta-helix repeat protein
MGAGRLGTAWQLAGALALLTGTLLGAGATPAAAAATPITACGQTVTTDAQLTVDLSCPAGDGIDVGAADITVDLGGHTITGSTGGNGVSITAFDDVTVTNGSLSGFATGVRVFNASGASVTNLDVTVAPGPLTSGVVLGNAQDSSVTGTTVRGGGIGVLVDGGSGNSIDGNDFEAPQQGVILSGAAGTSITSNRATGSAAGVAIGTTSTDTTVEGNVFTVGISGIYVDPFGNTGTVIRNNTANDFDSSGIFVDAGTSVTTIEGNRVERNDTGITVRTATTTITANQAFDNTALGIDAVAGVIDGGGNQASGNGDARQCVGVVCTDPFAPLTPVTPVTPSAAPAALGVAPRFTG